MNFVMESSCTSEPGLWGQRDGNHIARLWSVNLSKLCAWLAAITLLIACTGHETTGEDGWKHRRTCFGNVVDWHGEYQWDHGHVTLGVFRDNSSEVNLWIVQFDANGEVVAQSHTTEYEGRIEFDIDPNATRIVVTTTMPPWPGETIQWSDTYDMEF